MVQSTLAICLSCVKSVWSYTFLTPKDPQNSIAPYGRLVPIQNSNAIIGRLVPSETGGPSDQRGKKGGRFDYLCYG